MVAKQACTLHLFSKMCPFHATKNFFCGTSTHNTKTLVRNGANIQANWGNSLFHYMLTTCFNNLNMTKNYALSQQAKNVGQYCQDSS